MINRDFTNIVRPGQPVLRTQFNGLGAIDPLTGLERTTGLPGTLPSAADLPGVEAIDGNGNGNGPSTASQFGDWLTNIFKPTAAFIKETGIKPEHFSPGYAGSGGGNGYSRPATQFPWGPVILGVGTIAVIATMARGYGRRANPGLPNFGPLGWAAVAAGSLYLFSMRKKADPWALTAQQQAAAGPAYGPPAPTGSPVPSEYAPNGNDITTNGVASD